MFVKRTFPWRRLLSISPLVVAGSLLSACAAAPAAVEKVKVGIVTYITFSPFFIAEEEGYFDEQNLDVELVTFENSTLLMPALEQGQLDAAGNAPVAGMFNAIHQTGNIKIVADRGYVSPTDCSYVVILADPQWVDENPDPTAEAIRGMRFAVDINTFQAYILETYLGTLGLTLDDVQTQYVPPPNMIEAAKNGSVDFIISAEPWVTRLVDTGAVAIWKPIQEIVPDMQTGFLNYGKRLAGDHPEIGERFMVAYLQGVRRFNQGKTDRNVEIIAEYTKLDPELLRRICWPAMRDDGAVDLETIMDYQEWAVANGQLSEVAGEDAVWDSRFVNFANKQLG